MDFHLQTMTELVFESVREFALGGITDIKEYLVLIIHNSLLSRRERPCDDDFMFGTATILTSFAVGEGLYVGVTELKADVTLGRRDDSSAVDGGIIDLVGSVGQDRIGFRSGITWRTHGS